MKMINRLLTLLIFCSLLSLACSKNPMPQYTPDPYYCVDDDEEHEEPDPEPEPEPDPDPDPGPQPDPDPDPQPQPVDPNTSLDDFGHNDVYND